MRLISRESRGRFLPHQTVATLTRLSDGGTLWSEIVRTATITVVPGLLGLALATMRAVAHEDARLSPWLRAVTVVLVLITPYQSFTQLSGDA